MEVVFRQIDTDFDRHIARAQRLVRQPSVSASGHGIEDCAELVAAMIEEVGGVARVVPTQGYPVVYGEIGADRPTTLLLYGMYDVQPAEELGWTVDPFAGTVVNVADLGACLVARGATNSKGPLAGFLNVLDAYRQSREPLPVNVLFMVEGEEELGSRNLPAFVQTHRDELRRADAVYFPAYREDRRGVAYVQLGTKGALFLQLCVRGGEWGGPRNRAIHGAYNSWVGSPAWRAVRVLASLVDGEERVRIPGFYDGTLQPDADDERALTTLAEVLDPSALLEEYGASHFKYRGQAKELLKHLLFDPVLNLSGIRTGHTDAGTKSMIPHEVVIRCEFRLGPTTNPLVVRDALRAHLDAQGFGDVEIDVLAANPGSKVSVREPVVQALMAGYRAAGTTPYVHPLNAGWAPLYLFSEVLERPYVLGGLGHGERAHSSDELCTLDGLNRYEKAAAAFLAHFGRQATSDLGTNHH